MTIKIPSNIFPVIYSHRETQTLRVSEKGSKLAPLIFHSARENLIITFMCGNNNLFHRNWSVERNNDKMKEQ